MNSHDILKEKLFLYLDPETLPEERREVTVHLEACPECRETVARWQEVQRGLGHARLEPSGTFVYKVMERLAGREEAAKAAGSQAFLRWLFPALGYTFAVVLMFTAILHRGIPVTTEDILLAGLSRKAQTSFSAEAGVENLIGS